MEQMDLKANKVDPTAGETNASFVDRSRADMLRDLLAAQRKFLPAKRDGVNRFLDDTYATYASVYEACIPHMQEHGFVVLQYPTVRPIEVTINPGEKFDSIVRWTTVTNDGVERPHGGLEVSVRTTAIHVATGHHIENTMSAVSDGVTPPDIAKATTLLRRHGLLLLLNVPVEETQPTAATRRNGDNDPRRRAPRKPAPAKPAAASQPTTGRSTPAGNTSERFHHVPLDASEEEQLARIRTLYTKTGAIDAADKGEIRTRLGRVSTGQLETAHVALKKAVASSNPGSNAEINRGIVEQMVAEELDRR